MLFLAFALCVPAAIVRGEVGLADLTDAAVTADKWCCCDKKEGPHKFICVVGDKSRTIVQKAPEGGATVPVRGGITVTKTVTRTCQDDKEGKALVKACEGTYEDKEGKTTPCNTTTVMPMFSQTDIGQVDLTYTIPKSAWQKVNYNPSKYYKEEEWEKNHVSAFVERQTYYYAKADRAEGLAGKSYCVEYETAAYFKPGRLEAVGGDDWSCSQKEKCIKYVSMEDACGATFTQYGEGEVVTSPDKQLQKLGGELYELVGRKGDCVEEPAKPAEQSRARSTFSAAKNWYKSSVLRGAGSQCPAGSYHTGGMTVPYKFCDCNGMCK